MSLSDAFNSLLNLQGRILRIERPGGPYADIKASPSNYFRNLEGPSETVMKGREFVISKAVLTAANFPIPKRGDRLSDSEMGISVIIEVREMFDMGGAIIGYRVRCG